VLYKELSQLQMALPIEADQHEVNTTICFRLNFSLFEAFGLNSASADY
jgi:hypothetical protein